VPAETVAGALFDLLERTLHHAARHLRDPAAGLTADVLVVAVLLGLNDAVTPLGRPDADKLTLPLKPFCGVTVMLLVPFVPWITLRLLGEAERV